MSRTLRWAVPALLTAAVLTGCGSSTPASTSSATNPSAPSTTTSSAATGAVASGTAKPVSGHTTVAIRNFMFSPMHLTVTAGTKVSFHNYDQTAHTATAKNQSFDSNTINPGKTKTLTFSKPGTYAYYCEFHAFMTATITVVAK